MKMTITQTIGFVTPGEKQYTKNWIKCLNLRFGIVLLDAKTPAGSKTIKECKWGFDIKRTGVFCEPLVACRYSQVPGFDLQYFYSLVVNDCVF
jgi:hypothetical protein